MSHIAGGLHGSHVVTTISSNPGSGSIAMASTIQSSQTTIIPQLSANPNQQVTVQQSTLRQPVKMAHSVQPRAMGSTLQSSQIRVSPSFHGHLPRGLTVASALANKQGSTIRVTQHQPAMVSIPSTAIGVYTGLQSRTVVPLRNSTPSPVAVTTRLPTATSSLQRSSGALRHSNFSDVPRIVQTNNEAALSGTIGNTQRSTVQLLQPTDGNRTVLSAKLATMNTPKAPTTVIPPVTAKFTGSSFVNPRAKIVMPTNKQTIVVTQSMVAPRQPAVMSIQSQPAITQSVTQLRHTLSAKPLSGTTAPLNVTKPNVSLSSTQSIPTTPNIITSKPIVKVPPHRQLSTGAITALNGSGVSFASGAANIQHMPAVCHSTNTHNNRNSTIIMPHHIPQQGVPSTVNPAQVSPHITTQVSQMTHIVTTAHNISTAGVMTTSVLTKPPHDRPVNLTHQSGDYSVYQSVYQPVTCSVVSTPNTLYSTTSIYQPPTTSVVSTTSTPYPLGPLHRQQLPATQYHSAYPLPGNNHLTSPHLLTSHQPVYSSAEHGQPLQHPLHTVHVTGTQQHSQSSTNASVQHGSLHNVHSHMSGHPIVRHSGIVVTTSGHFQPEHLQGQATLPVSIPRYNIMMDSDVKNSLAMNQHLQHPITADMDNLQSNQSDVISSILSTQAASPRPSILRKRTHDGTIVKKSLFGGDNSDMKYTNKILIPRPVDPSRENSQSSTDTATSNESTPKSISLDDIKIKTENELCTGLNLSIPVTASPRKKPRKQRFDRSIQQEYKDDYSTDEEISYCDIDQQQENEKDEVSVKQEIVEEEPSEYIDNEGVRWCYEKPRLPIFLLNHYHYPWKTKAYHFQRYNDVKAKDERRPTVNELSNQKNVTQKASGWKVHYLAAQLQELMELENNVLVNFTDLHEGVDERSDEHKYGIEDDMGMVNELAKGNIQRSKLLVDQLSEAHAILIQMLNHKIRIKEIIQKHHSKRTVKKKERN